MAMIFQKGDRVESYAYVIEPRTMIGRNQLAHRIADRRGTIVGLVPDPYVHKTIPELREAYTAYYVLFDGDAEPTNCLAKDIGLLNVLERLAEDVGEC